MSVLINDVDRQGIRAAIEQAESKTSGELVTVIARASDEYLFIPIMWAALIALLVPGLLMLSNAWVDYSVIYTAQVATFFICNGLFRIPAIKMRLIPRRVKHQRAARYARELFVTQNLHTTREHTGILIFVSAAEHYVEIIADKGINDVVDSNTWQIIVDDFILHVKNDEYGKGFIRAIEQCGEKLQQHFPSPARNPNELPNHLIELH